MRSDHELKNRVLHHLDLDPSIDSSRIGVTVLDRTVTLSGHVPSVGERRAARVATGSVPGIEAVINGLAVELPESCRKPDELIAVKAYASLESNRYVPLDHIHLTISDGTVTLSGDVAWNDQRQAVEDGLHQLECVRHIENEIVIKRPIEVGQVRGKVRQAVARIAPLSARQIDVEAEGIVVTLVGTANSLHECGLAESAAWSIPGARKVTNHISVV